MELAVTIIEPSRRRRTIDLRLTAGAGHTCHDLRGALSDRLDRPIETLWCEGTPLDPSAPIGLPPLVHGAALTVDPPSRRTPPPGSSVHLTVVAGPDAARTVRLDGGGTILGRAPLQGLAIDDPRLSREHVALHLDPGGVHVQDLDSTNGVATNGRVVDGATTVTGELDLTIGSSRLRVLAAEPAVRSTTSQGDGTLHLHRAPRVVNSPAAQAVRAPHLPEEREPARMPWVAAVIPLPFAALLAAAFGPQLLLFAVLSPAMLLGTWANDRLLGGRLPRRAVREYDLALEAALSELERAVHAEATSRHTASPGPAEVLRTACGPGPDLWARTPAHADFATVRLGLGEVNANVRWEQADGVEHPQIVGVPVITDLRAGPGLGLCGPAARTDALLRSIVGQLVTQASPRFVRLWVLDDDPTWRPLQLLPHAATSVLADPETRSPEALLDALAALVSRRREAGEREGSPTPTLEVVVAPSIRGLGASLRRELDDLADRAVDLGLVVVSSAQTASDLPSACGAVVEVSADATARLHRPDLPTQECVLDGVGSWWLERLTRALAPLRDATQDGAERLPDSIALLDLLDVDPADPRTIAEAWAAGRGPVATLGWADGEPWRVDLRRDGPHVLVGGTTGSGKSELLQSFVVSLATTCSPRDLAFVLVDYKGGSAFGGVAHLPHTVGVVTDLDPRLADRALTSLTAELKHRERRLAEHGARDLDDYRHRVGNECDLPRLVIVIDEFRILADELPDFLDGLVRIAAVGRSLGIHLVLATQRPAGVVSADIAANVNLRIALRVRDRADSQDLIDAPDAASIPTHFPGRGLARAGGGDLVHFQGARATGTSAPDLAAPMVLSALDEPSPAGITSGPSDGDLFVLVTGVRAAAELSNLPAPRSPWQPPLPDALPATAASPAERIVIGVEDHPAQQRTAPMTWHPDDGLLLAVGSPRSGRTTAAATVITQAAARWASDELHVHVIGGAELAGLEQLPHLGSVVSPDDTHLLGRLLDRLTEQLSAGRSDFTSRTLLVIDGWERLAALDPLSTDPVTERLVRLLRDGRREGLTAVVTGDRSALLGPLPSIASSTLLLRMADPVDAGLVGLRPSDLPLTPPPGRALRVGDRVEVQIAHPGTAPEPSHLLEVCRLLASRWPSPSPDGAPFRLSPLPPRCSLADLHAMDGPEAADTVRLGVGGDTGSILELDPQSGRHFLVVGPPHSGRTTALTTLARELARTRHTVAVLSTGGTELTDLVGPEVHGFRLGELDGLVDLRRAHPDLALLVDGIDRLQGTAAEVVVTEIMALTERDRGFVAGSADLAGMTTAFRGPAVELARRGHGLLLTPRAPHDGEVFGVRAPRSLGTNPGRALLVARGRITPLQVAQPN